MKLNRRFHRTFIGGPTARRNTRVVDMLIIASVIVIVAMCSGRSHAFELCWENPNENVDGTPLTDLTGLNIYIGLQLGGPYDHDMVVYPDTVAGASRCTEITVSPGTYFVRATAYDAQGNESGYSNEVVKTQIDSSPLPPIALPTTRTVYTVIKQPDRFVLLPIGTVPPGTECDPNNSVNGHGVVPNESVIWNVGSTARPIVVVALCDG